jgi:hypothetical protein
MAITNAFLIVADEGGTWFSGSMPCLTSSANYRHVTAVHRGKSDKRTRYTA